MDQLRVFADNRLISGCIYCGGAANSRDHVPSRAFLEPPYPENLPVVGACKDCNLGFSMDEEYCACIVEAAIVGSADPNFIRRPSVAKSLRRSARLRAQINNAKGTINGQTGFFLETDRIENVLLKLARGHAAFELSQPCRRIPDYFWAGSLALISDELRNTFNEPHEQQMLGEVGSRGMQRLLVSEIFLQSVNNSQSVLKLLINEWVHVQDDHYRYLAIDDIGGIVIRIVIAECLACEVAWLDEVTGNK